MPVKVTYFFDFAKSGWSETHYLMTSNALDFAAASAAKHLAVTRAAMLGGPVTVGGVNVGQPFLNWIRLSLDGVFRDSELVRDSGTEQNALALGATWPTPSIAQGVFRNLSLRCRGQAADKKKRAILYLGGMPDAIFVGDTSYSFASPVGFFAAWNQFVSEITSGVWGFRCQNNGAAIQVKNVIVENVAPSRLQLVMTGALTTVGPPPATIALVAGDDIQLRNFTAISRAYKPLNGHFIVADYNPTGGPAGEPLITLANTENRDPTLIRHMGTAESVAKAPVAYDEFFALGPSSRKRGLGLGSPVGRKRAAKQYAG